MLEHTNLDLTLILTPTLISGCFILNFTKIKYVKTTAIQLINN